MNTAMYNIQMEYVLINENAGLLLKVILFIYIVLFILITQVLNAACPLPYSEAWKLVVSSASVFFRFSVFRDYACVCPLYMVFYLQCICMQRPTSLLNTLLWVLKNKCDLTFVSLITRCLMLMLVMTALTEGSFRKFTILLQLVKGKFLCWNAVHFWKTSQTLVYDVRCKMYRAVQRIS